jgi:hypothetical protein
VEADGSSVDADVSGALFDGDSAGWVTAGREFSRQLERKMRSRPQEETIQFEFLRDPGMGVSIDFLLSDSAVQ